MTVRLTLDRIAVALLAGGLSSRYAGGDKLLALLHGKPLIQYAAEAICELQGVSRLAVVPPGKLQLAQHLRASSFNVISTDAPPHGMGHSIAKAAAAALATPAEALLICLGDMPFVTAATLGQLVAELAAQPEATIAVCGELTKGGRQTPPVLFRRCHFSELTKLAGDNGGKALIQQYARQVVTLSLPTAQRRDLDTDADFRSV